MEIKLNSLYKDLLSYLLMLLIIIVISSCKSLPKEAYVNSLVMTMVPIPSGSFQMGQERNSDLPLTLTYGDRYFLGGEIQADEEASDYNWPQTLLMTKHSTMSEYKHYAQANHLYMVWGVPVAILQYWPNMTNLLSIIPWKECN